MIPAKRNHGRARGGKGRGRGFAVASMLLGLLFGLVVLEIGLRIVGYSSPEFYAPDEKRGYGLIPGMTGTYSKEGRSYVSINSDGFRDIEHAVAKPPDTLRVAFVGDSYVEALQVEQDESFTRHAADHLERCGAFGGRKIEVLSFGVSGYGTVQELVTVRERVLKYSPDLVVLVMTTNNDITDNSPYFKKQPIPYIGIDGSIDESFRNDKRFIARSSSLSHAGIWLKNRLRFVQAVGAAATAIKYRYQRWRDEAPAIAGTALQPAPVEIGIDNQVYREPGGDEWRTAWQLTETAVLELRKDVVSAGSALVVVTGSNAVQVLPDPAQRDAFARAIGAADLFYPDRRIAEFCASNAIPSITLAPILAERAARDGVYLHGFAPAIGTGHWNQFGHKAAGEAIGARLCEAHP